MAYNRYSRTGPLDFAQAFTEGAQHFAEQMQMVRQKREELTDQGLLGSTVKEIFDPANPIKDQADFLQRAMTHISQYQTTTGLGNYLRTVVPMASNYMTQAESAKHTKELANLDLQAKEMQSQIDANLATKATQEANKPNRAVKMLADATKAGVTITDPATGRPYGETELDRLYAAERRSLEGGGTTTGAGSEKPNAWNQDVAVPGETPRPYAVVSDELKNLQWEIDDLRKGVPLGMPLPPDAAKQIAEKRARATVLNTAISAWSSNANQQTGGSPIIQPNAPSGVKAVEDNFYKQFNGQ